MVEYWSIGVLEYWSIGVVELGSNEVMGKINKAGSKLSFEPL